MNCWILYCCYRTQNSHGILARLTQILSYNTLLKRTILFDAQACSSPVIRISLHMTSRVVFAQGQFLMLFVVCFQWPVYLKQGRVTIIEVLQVIYKVLRRFLCSFCQLYVSADPALCLLCLLKRPRDLTRINLLT